MIMPRRMESELFRDPDPVAAYLDEISGSHKLTSKEEKALAVRIRKGDRTALNLLVTSNLKFVVAVCRNYRNQGMSFGDLINEGNLGLMRAAARFDEHQDCRFVSYAVWWIRQGIMEAMAQQTREVALSSSTTTAINRINVAVRKLTQKLGRNPGLEELELETGYTAGRIADCRRLMEPSLSLDYPSGHDESTIQDRLADGSDAGTGVRLERFQTERTLARILKGLNRRERMVIESLYGLGDGNAMTVRSLAAKLGVSMERIRQLKAAALNKLKGLLELAAKYPCFPGC
jgi:RNA polymerase primary sigma factor